jgi:hypothetical protein
MVRLDSRGGDVFSAMKIGRFIRKYDAHTLIVGKCYSSCALIFIAGVLRWNWGELGLHRPYLATAPQSRQTIEKQLPFILSQIKNYVAEMGITENFYNQMVNTEPSQILIYKSDDAKTIVPQYDPVYDEVLTSYHARAFGVTTSEMRQRERDAEKCLNLSLLERFVICSESIRWGLSERVYQERHDKSRACGPTDEDWKIVKSSPLKEARDHPLYVRSENCRRNIMLGR